MFSTITLPGEATAAYSEGISIDPDFKAAYELRGFAFYGLGDLGVHAPRASRIEMIGAVSGIWQWYTTSWVGSPMRKPS